MQSAATNDERSLRPSGYVSWLEELWYGSPHPFYDLLTWWCFLPLGGEAACRREFARWVEPRAGERIVSLCCGSGTTERAILALEPEVQITGIDLGAGQIARARRRTPGGEIEFRRGNAADTGLEAGGFDRVVITLALHEMPRSLRLSVLSEAKRLCRPAGRVIAIEHGRPRSFAPKLLRALWWFYWLPGNPELATTRDLQRRGLENEMKEAGLEPLARRVSRLGWVEGRIAKPV